MVCSAAGTSSGACNGAQDECVSGANAQKFCRSRLLPTPAPQSGSTSDTPTSGNTGNGVSANGMLPEASGCSSAGSDLPCAALTLLLVALWARRRSAT